MAKILSPEDVPELLELFSTENESPVDIQFVLASQCRADLEDVNELHTW